MTLREGASLRDIAPGPLGMIYHPKREHVPTERVADFDEGKYGLTRSKMKEISDWLSIQSHQVVVVTGPTGSGKSTALPHWLMYPPKGLPQDQYLKYGQVIITQPRIIAAEGIATHVGGTLLGGTVGKGFDVGFRHSGSRSTDWRNSLVFETDGTLLNMITRDALDGVSVIMIDEAHERSLNIDLILRLLKEKLPLYPNLKLIIASATIDAHRFKDYFGDDTAMIVSLEGKSAYGYDTHFADPKEALTYEDNAVLKDQLVPALVRQIKRLVAQMQVGEIVVGDILSFLQGVDPIERAVESVRTWASKQPEFKKRVEVYPLYSALPEKEQEVVRKANKNPNLIRVIISTNVAEASITVDGCVYVVESGVENQARWDATTRSTEIKLVTTSRANAQQRWGRCGRNRHGEVYCLYTEKQFDNGNLFGDYPVPEIQRSDLEPIVLAAKAAGIEDVFNGWIQDPPKEEVDRAITVLRNKGALSEQEYLTPYGSLLRYFSYPAEIADLIMLADRLGVVVELATLLPFIRNGGQRYFLDWDRDWDRYKKRTASNFHKALMNGCKDDVEFILKLSKCWEEVPWIDYPAEKRPMGNELRILREEWANRNFIDLEGLEKVLSEDGERTEILNKLYVRRKSSGFRPIFVELIDKVRFLLMLAFPDQKRDAILDTNLGNYRFDPFKEPAPDSLVTVSTHITKEEMDRASELKGKTVFEIAEAVTKVNIEQASRESVTSRMFLEQYYPLGAIVNCQLGEKRVSKQIPDYASVEILSLAPPLHHEHGEGILKEKRKKKSFRRLRCSSLL
ncbi:MAG: hypothetical protein L0Y56_00985, partial [Nitrospira sp.]|nr:hypothetical protein [Nitrospira sp.]